MITFFLERNEKRMNPADPEAKNYIVFVMKGMSYLKSDLRKLRQFVKQTADSFPELLGYALVCNADTLTYPIWKMIYPLLDKRTKS
jgi:hypothetical protein